MTGPERRAILHLRDGLESLNLIHKPFGFGLLTCNWRLPLDLDFWQGVQDHFVRNHPGRMRAFSLRIGSLEMFSQETVQEAILWWGNAAAIEEYKSWAARAYACFWKYVLPVYYSATAWHGLLRTFCYRAELNEVVSPFVRKAVMDESNSLGITFREVVCDAIPFSLVVLDHILGATPKHLEIRKADNIAMLNGVPFPLCREQTLIFSLLLEADANCMSGPKMQKAEPELKGKRIDRLLDSEHLPEPLYVLVKRSTKTGYGLLLS